MPVPEQWQMTLDVIKSKAQTLMVENNGLQVEYQQLTGQAQVIQKAIYEQQDKNAKTEHFLKQRHGRTDQQLRIEELTQTVNSKRQELHTYDEQMKDLKRKQISQHIAQPRVDDQLGQWRKKLEDENKKEALLEYEFKNLPASLDILREQKLQRYDELKKRKEQLEAYISVYESRMDDLRVSSPVELSWSSKRKKLVHDMVQSDARNNKIREKIKVLREDIEVLKDQVARLEKRVNFARGQDNN